MQNLWIGSDNSVSVTGLTNEVTGAYINDATATFTLCDQNGTNLVEDEPMPYVAGSNGNYRGIITDTISVSCGRDELYCVKVTIDAGPSYRDYREMSCCAMVRDELT